MSESEVSKAIVRDYSAQGIISEADLAQGMGYYIDDEGNLCSFGLRLPRVSYNGYEYKDYKKIRDDCDENWLNENFVFIGDVVYYPDYAPEKDRGDFTTNIDPDSCKIYRCSDEDRLILTLWSSGSVSLYIQDDLSDEEKESAVAEINWEQLLGY